MLFHRVDLRQLELCGETWKWLYSCMNGNDILTWSLILASSCSLQRLAVYELVSFFKFALKFLLIQTTRFQSMHHIDHVIVWFQKRCIKTASCRPCPAMTDQDGADNIQTPPAQVRSFLLDYHCVCLTWVSEIIAQTLLKPPTSIHTHGKPEWCSLCPPHWCWALFLC